MAKICLPKLVADGLRQALNSKTLDPDVLAKLSSQDRRKVLSNFVGEEYAPTANSLFESKLVLPNRQEALKKWAAEVTNTQIKPAPGILDKVLRTNNELTPERIAKFDAKIAERKTPISDERYNELVDKIKRNSDLLTSDNFLNDLVNTKLGVNVTDTEAKQIASLAKEASAARTAMEKGKRRGIDGVPTETELAYGLNTVKLNDYVNELKKGEKQTPLDSILQNPLNAVKEAASLTKSLKSSLDVSATLRQGVKTLFSNPKEFFKNAPKQIADIQKTLAGKDAQGLLNAEIISDPMYELMKKAKLAVGSIEEAFPSQIQEKIPGIGRLFKASDAAYSGFLHRMRVDLFKKYVNLAESQGVNINSAKEVESIAKMVNSLTGRGDLGAAESAANFLNVTMFSPRNLKSHIDTLTMHQLQKDVSPFVRKQAAINLVKTLVGVSSVLGVASQLWPDSVETDPRSADFSKIRIGNTRFDVAGGMGSLATLFARLAPIAVGQNPSTKSTKTGKVKELNTGEYGSQTGKDVFIDFFTNKASPLASEALTRLQGEDFDGNKPSILNSLKNLFAPLGIANIYETKDEKDRANLLLIGIMDALGIGSSTY